MDPITELADRQLAAYNRKDMDAWLATYAPDAEQYDIEGRLLARGHAQMRERMAARFAEPDLHARLIQRIVMGDVVVDHEEVTRNFPEGLGSLPMLCVYRVVDGRFARATFALGERRLRAWGGG